MTQQELFSTTAFDDRCRNLFNYIKANWELNRVAVVYRLDFLLKCSSMYKVNCETVLKEWERYLQDELEKSYEYSEHSKNS